MKITTLMPQSISAALVLMIGPGMVHAQGESPQKSGVLEEIVVTAQRREQNLMDVPISVVALSEEFLGDAAINSTLSLPQMVPSVQLVRSGPGALFFIRGVGNISGGSGEESPNAFYVDGVYIYEKNQSALKFNNVERVEVLKGPQGTLFGRNAAGGLIHVITREPGDVLEAKFNVGYGSYDTFAGQGYVGGPLTDTLSADIAITATDQDEGWGDNLTTGEDVSKGWDWGLRSKWVWRPAETLKATFAGEYGKQKDDFTNSFRMAQGVSGLLGTMPADDPWDTVVDQPGLNEQRNFAGSATIDWNLDWADFTSITAYRNNDNLSSFDLDTGPLPLGFVSVDTKSDSFQQEFRLASNNSGPLSWQAGIFYLDAQVELIRQRATGLFIPTVADISSTMDTESLAGFGELNYEITPRTSLIAGARYTRDKLSMVGQTELVDLGFTVNQVDESETFSGETFRLAIQHEYTDNVSVYASYNRGYKSGTYSPQSYADPPVEPQETDAFEVGLKSQLLDQRLRFNISAYHYEISEYQTRASSDGDATARLLNAAEVEIDGVDVEFQAAVTDGLRLFGSATFLDSEIQDFPLAPHRYPNPAVCTPNGPEPGVVLGDPVGGVTECLGSAEGHDAPFSPEFAANLGGSYTARLGDGGEVRLTLVYSYNDGYYFQPDNQLYQPSFENLNATLGYYPNETWGVELWGRNLTDELHYVMNGSAFDFFSVPGEPRVFGMKLYYNH